MAEIVVKLVNGELAGKTAQTIAKEVNAAALALKKAEIGTKEWVAANEKLEGAKQLQADMKKQIEGTAKASDMLKASWNKLPGAQFFNQIGDSIGMMKQGVGGLISSMGVLKGAIAATGIGALVLVITSLVAWFAKTDEGATKLDGIMRAIGNTVDVLLNRLINLKQSLISLFTNPGQFFKGLFADIEEGIELGQELAETFDTLDQKRRDMELVDASQSVAIQKLLLQSKNVSLSYEERLAILAKVDAMERENHDSKMKYAVEYATAVTKETEQMEKSGTITDEQLDKQNEARIKLLAVQGESIVLQEKIENRRSQLLEKQQAERDKDLAKREKENEQLLKQQEKFYQDKHKLQEQEEIFQENRRAADAEREKKRIQDSMVLAAKQLQAKIDADKAEQASKQALADAIAMMEQTKMELFNEGVNSVVALLAVDEAARRKNAAAIKTFTMAQIAVNLQDEIQGIWANANKNPSNALFPGSGNIIAGFKTAFAVVRAATATRRVLSTKFETGGPINGPRHSGGGVNINAEGGEFIFSRKAVQAIGMQNLTAMNSRLTFANGGPVSPFGSGSARANGGTGGGVDPFTKLEAKLEQLGMNIAQAINTKVDRIRVINNVGDTEKGIKVLNQVKAEADV